MALTANTSTTNERLPLKLSQAQRLTILRYAELPDQLAERVAARARKRQSLSSHSMSWTNFSTVWE